MLTLSVVLGSLFLAAFVLFPYASQLRRSVRGYRHRRRSPAEEART